MFDHPTPQLPITEQTFDKLESKVLDLYFRPAATTEYFIAETGAGKSRAIAEFVRLYGRNIRLVIVLNSKVDVIEKAENLKGIRGLSVVSWLSEENNTIEKSDLKPAQVAVVTHQFFTYPGNREFLGDRDIFIVDEMPIWQKSSNFKLSNLAKALERSTSDRDNLGPSRNSMNWLASVKPNTKYLPITEVEYPVLFEGLRQLAQERDNEIQGYFAIYVGWPLRVHSTRAPDVVW